MIDWLMFTPYFCTMRRVVILLFIALLFWGCPGNQPVNVSTEPLSAHSFVFLQDDNKLAFSIVVEPSLNGTQLSSVWVDWYGTNAATTPDTIALYDDGSHGDIIGDDQVWMRKIVNAPSIELTNSVSVNDSGKVYAIFNALFGSQLSTVSDSFHLGNLKPYLISVTAPDTVTRPNAGTLRTIEINCQANDGNGLSDIRWVGFRSYSVALDSFLYDGGYILLYDDGSDSVLYQPDLTSGDAVANDGIFTITAQIPSTANTGAFDWIFEAQDKHYEYSDTLVHRIVVQ